MPWVNITTAKKLSSADRAKIASGVADALKRHIDKDPAGVFVSFTKAEEFYWGGVATDQCSMFDLRWIGEFSEDQKTAIAGDICGALAPAVDIDGKRTRVVFTSKASEDWGRPK